jgi:NAD(P)-dependent dehydrogenase (short-subunit alcohol dehydrogenase family)
VNEAWKVGVTVNIIAPGPVQEFTSFNEAGAYCSHNDEWQQRNKVSPQDIAEGVAFLCSDAAKYITGCTLPYVF